MSSETYSLVERYCQAPYVYFLTLLKVADGFGGNGDDPRELVFSFRGLAQSCHMDVAMLEGVLGYLAQRGDIRIEREESGRTIHARLTAGEGRSHRHE